MPAYYNENDPYCAGWLGNLADEALILGGRIDSRSIADVEPVDLIGYRHCHFFAGVGGWARALQLAGWDDDRSVWTGSCPCQPFSSAGKQGGAADERHLWPQWFRLIRECRPDIIFGEQVAGAVGFGWLDRVFADLEAAGYACGAAVLGAHSVGAPHIRARLFWVADAASERECSDQSERDRGDRQFMVGSGARRNGSDDGAAGGMADAGNGRCAQPSDVGEYRARDQQTQSAGSGAPGGLADAQGERERGNANTLGRPQREEESGQSEPWNVGERIRDRRATGGLDYTAGSRRQSEGSGQSSESEWRHGVLGMGREIGGMADAECDGGWTDLARRGPEGRTADFWSDAVWLPCLDGKARRVESSIQPLAHGVSARVGRLRAYGNAIVPQVAAEFIQCFLSLEVR